MITKNCDNGRPTAKMYFSHFIDSKTSPTLASTIKSVSETCHHDNSEAAPTPNNEVSSLLLTSLRYPELISKMMLNTLLPERSHTERIDDSANRTAGVPAPTSQRSMVSDLLTWSHLNTYRSSQQASSNGWLSRAPFQGHAMGGGRSGKRDTSREEVDQHLALAKVRVLHSGMASSLTSAEGTGNRVDGPSCSSAMAMAEEDRNQGCASQGQKSGEPVSSGAVDTAECNGDVVDPETDPDESESVCKSSHSLQCVVCGDKSSGKHYGQHTCEGCKSFFKRSVRRKLTYTCRGEHECPIDIHHRNQCQYCRFQKCIKEGMRREGQGEATTTTTTTSISFLPTSWNPAVQPGRLVPYQSLYNPLLAHPNFLRGRPLPPGTDYLSATASVTATIPCQLMDMFVRAEPARAAGTLWPLGPSDRGLLLSGGLTAQVGEGVGEGSRGQDSDGVGCPEKRVQSQGTGLHRIFIQILIAGIQWARNIPLFNELKLTDKQLLLRRSWLELFLLNLAYNCPHLATTSIFQLIAQATERGRLPSEQGRTSFSSSSGRQRQLEPRRGDRRKVGGVTVDRWEVEEGPTVRWGRGEGAPTREEEPHVNQLKNVFDQLEYLMSLQVDATELACMKAIVLFNSDVSGLSDPRLVDCMQEKAQWALSEYCRCQYTYCQQPFRFGRLLLRLPRLRNQHAKFISDAFFGSSDLVDRLLCQTDLPESGEVEKSLVAGSSDDLYFPACNRLIPTPASAPDAHSPKPADLSQHSTSLPTGEQLTYPQVNDGIPPIPQPVLPWQHVLPNFCLPSYTQYLQNRMGQSDHSCTISSAIPWTPASNKSSTSSQFKQDGTLNQTIDLLNRHDLERSMKYSGNSSFNLSFASPCTDDSDKSSINLNLKCDTANRSFDFNTIPWSAKPEHFTAPFTQSANIQSISSSGKDKLVGTEARDSDALDSQLYYSVIRHHLGQIQKQTSSMLTGGQSLNFSSGLTELFNRSRR